MPKTPTPSPQDLKRLAKKRLQEAEVLFAKGKYEGTVYLCGYAIELALKARICKTLKWTTFPDSEVHEPRTFTTHHLPTLLSLSGIQHKVKSNHLTEWSAIEKWTPEMRYVLNPDILKPTVQQPTVQQQTQNILNSVKTLIKIL